MQLRPAWRNIASALMLILVVVAQTEWFQASAIGRFASANSGWLLAAALVLLAIVTFREVQKWRQAVVNLRKPEPTAEELLKR